MSDAFTLQGRVEVDVNSVIKDLQRLGYEVEGVGKKTKSLSDKMSSIGKGMASFGSTMTKFVTTPLLGAGTASFKMASDMSESLNKVEVACGSGADEVKKFANTTLKSFGIAKGTSLDMMSTFSDMGGGMGLTTDQANKMSMSLVGLAGDLASFKNVRVDVAKTALNGIYTGETESLKQLGIVMTQQNLIEYAASQGIKKKVKDMSQAELVQLRYNYVMEKTKNAQGDFARTSDGASNQMRIFTEGIKELASNIGENLLPIITPIIQKLNEWVQKFGAMDKETQQVILKVGGLFAVLGPGLLILGKTILIMNDMRKAFMLAKTAIVGFEIKTKLATMATKLMAIAQGALNFVMSLNPILLVVIAIGVLVGAIIYLWNTSEGFRTFITNMWEGIKTLFMDFNTFLTGLFQTDFTQAFGAIGNVCNAFFANVKNIWDSIKQIFGGIVDFIAGVFTGDWERAWQGVCDIFGGIMNGLGAIIKAPINAVIGIINMAIDGINSISFSVPDWVPFVGGKSFAPNFGKINYLYEGGIVNQPTLLGGSTVVGDAYKGKGNQSEVVVPLDQLIQWIEKVASRPISVELDGRQVMRGLSPYQNEFEKYNKVRFA